MKPKKVILIIRDGWGESNKVEGNAIKKANTPNHDNYIENYPTTFLKCSGSEVGNPEMSQGGSEVGHLVLGAGRIILQPQVLINRAIEDSSLSKNREILGAIKNCKKNNSALHVAGLFSDIGVHSEINHLFFLLDLAKKNNLKNVFIHLILDGIDAPEKSALIYLGQLEILQSRIGIGKIATIVGRHYAMDRDLNWDRTKLVYKLMTVGSGNKAKNAREAIKFSYDKGIKSDCFVQPTVIIENQKPVGLIKNKDSLIWFNFRKDRSKQIIQILKEKVNPCIVSFFNLFPPEKVFNNLSEVLSKNNKQQLRIAETLKYPHVTFFFNSQQKIVYEGEDRILVNSKNADIEVSEKVLEKIGKYDFILVNFANPDLAGHKGIFKEIIEACEKVDECVGKIVDKAIEKDYYVIVGADHGNAESMLGQNGDVDVSHGFNPVTYSFIGDKTDIENIELKPGSLKDVAPTILELMGIEKPKEMMGKSLIK